MYVSGTGNEMHRDSGEREKTLIAVRLFSVVHCDGWQKWTVLKLLWLGLPDKKFISPFKPQHPHTNSPN